MDAIKISIASLVSPLANHHQHPHPHSHPLQHRQQHQHSINGQELLPAPTSLAPTLTNTIQATAGVNSSSVSCSSSNNNSLTTSHPHHLPIDYSLGNFKPAIAADFPTPFSTLGPTCLQVRDAKGSTLSLPPAAQHNLILQRLGGQHAGMQRFDSGDRSSLEETLPPGEQQPMSAFKAVLPKKKNTDGEFSEY